MSDFNYFDYLDEVLENIDAIDTTQATFEDTLSFAYWVLDKGKNTIPSSYHLETILHTYTKEQLEEFIQRWIPQLPDPVNGGVYKTKHLTRFINQIK